MSDKIVIFDTTLRDGEQSPGASLNLREKLKIAKQLARLGVDIIEAGFPISSNGDFEAVKGVAQEVEGVTVAALARAVIKDIDRAWEAVQYAQRPRIHMFIATSDIHLKYKLKRSREEVLEAAVAAVKHAKNYTDDVEFSAEDSTRSDMDYLCRVVEAVINAGATTVNIPDTVGYSMPTEFGARIANICNRVPNVNKAVISVHCHNDLGLAVANSLAAVANGARQVECTINGLGERAGNASLEEVVMALKTRHDLFNIDTDINTQEIYQSSRMVSNLTGLSVQRNKAIVGQNAFAHASGIHQDGMLKEKLTYEIMTPESIGLSKSTLVLGKLSGRHALKDRLRELGYELKAEELDRAFLLFKDLADKKKEVFDEDLIALVNDELVSIPETFSLESIHITAGTEATPTAQLRLRKSGEIIEKAANGDGPVDATYNAIDQITGLPGKLLDYSVRGVTRGKDAMGEVRLRLEIDGRVVSGKSASTDIFEASAKAYLHAVNRAIFEKDEK